MTIRSLSGHSRPGLKLVAHGNADCDAWRSHRTGPTLKPDWSRWPKRRGLRDHQTVSLTRFWFEFDLDGHRPPAPAPGAMNLDGGSVQYQWLSLGAGVTAHDEEDALTLLLELVGADLPPRIRTVTDDYADRAALGIPDFLVVGNAAWRGVWFPPDNLRGPSR